MMELIGQQRQYCQQPEEVEFQMVHKLLDYILVVLQVLLLVQFKLELFITMVKHGQEVVI